jgi:pimeloyl-ACP methyl ester carboxylesterase
VPRHPIPSVNELSQPSNRRFNRWFRGTLKNIYSGVVVFSREKDFLTPTEHSDLMEASIPSARRFHFEDCVHMVLHEAADDLNDVLRGFAYFR